MSKFYLNEILTLLEESIRDRDVVKFRINCDRLGIAAHLDNTTVEAIFEWLIPELYNPDFHSFPEDAVGLLVELFDAAGYQDYLDEQQLEVMWEALTKNIGRFRDFTVCLFLEELTVEMFPNRKAFVWLMQLVEERTEPAYLSVPSALYHLLQEVDDRKLIQDISDALKILSQSPDESLKFEAVLYYAKVLHNKG